MSELACTYAALILHDDGVEISADNISAIVKAAGVTVEPYWPGLFAKLFERKSLEDYLGAVGSAPAAGAVAMGGGGGAAAAGGDGGAAEEKEEEKKEEEEEETDSDIGMSLFD